MEGGLRGGPAQASAAVIQATQGAAELDLASLMRLAGAQHQLQALGVYNGMMGNGVVNPVVAHLGGPPLGGVFPHPQSTPPRMYSNLWPQLQSWSLGGQWLPPGAGLLPAQALVSASASPLASQIPPVSGMQPVVNIQHLQQLQQQLEGQGNTSKTAQASEPEGPKEAKNCGGQAEGKNDNLQSFLAPPTTQGPAQEFPPIKEDTRIPPDILNSQEANGTTLDTVQHVHKIEPGRVCSAGTDLGEGCGAEGSKALNHTGSFTGGTWTSYGECPQQSNGRELQTETCVTQTVPQPATFTGDKTHRSLANCAGSHESRVNGNGRQELDSSDPNASVGREAGQALAEKLGEQVFWQVRSLLLQQQEVFLSQVWELHRLHWFQTYLQTLLKVPDQGSILHSIMRSSSVKKNRSSNTGLQPTRDRNPELGINGVCASHGGLIRPCKKGKYLPVKQMHQSSGSPCAVCPSRIQPWKQEAYVGKGSTCVPKRPKAMKSKSHTRSKVLVNDVHDAAVLLKACSTKADQQNLAEFNTRCFGRKDHIDPFTQTTENKLLSEPEIGDKVLQASGVSQVQDWPHKISDERREDCPEVSSSRQDVNAPLWDSKKTSCKSFSAKFHGEFQDAPHFVNVEYGGCEDISINEHNPDTYLCKSKGIGVRTSQRTEVNGKPTRKMKRKFATLPVKARKKGKKFAPLVDECESIGSGRSGSYDGQEDGSPTGAKERKAADVLLKYLPSAIMSGVQS